MELGDIFIKMQEDAAYYTHLANTCYLKIAHPTCECEVEMVSTIGTYNAYDDFYQIERKDLNFTFLEEDNYRLQLFDFNDNMMEERII